MTYVKMKESHLAYTNSKPIFLMSFATKISHLREDLDALLLLDIEQIGHHTEVGPRRNYPLRQSSKTL